MLHRHLFKNRAICASAAMIAVFVISGAAHGGAILFVDDDAPLDGDGTTWDTAYRFLQDALTTAGDPDEGIILVRVGQGTYVPSQTEKNPNGGDQTMSFHLINGIVIAGGYAGIGEPDPNERNIELYQTILDGMQSSYTVVNGSNTTASAVLDGFTITGGNASGPGGLQDSFGGGMYLANGSPTIANCVFTENQADTSAGAVRIQTGSNASFTACTFSDNTAPDGGAVSISGSNSNPEFTDCTFSNNAASRGGAMYSDESSQSLVGCTFDGNTATGDDGFGAAWQIFGGGNPVLTDCTFINNIADGKGGGINVLFNTTASLTLTSCIFSGNEASEGGALHIHPSAGVALLQLLDCSFDGNSAGSLGGGLSIVGTTVGITGCTFTGNTAGSGGGVFSESSSSSVTNCLFFANSSVLGGAMTNAGGDLIVTNCSFSGNTADDSGGGMFNSGSVTVRNSVLWGNSDIGGNDESAQIHVLAGTTNVNYSCIQGGWSGDGGVGIVTDDPLFVDAKGGDLHLSAGSPCNDAADNSAVPKEITTDLDDGPRFLDDAQTTITGIGDCPIVDMGSYEFQMACPDIDGNNVVGASDLLSLLAAWGTCEPGDFDADGNVGAFDLLALLANWGPCP